MTETAGGEWTGVGLGRSLRESTSLVRFAAAVYLASALLGVLVGAYGGPSSSEGGSLPIAEFGVVNIAVNNLTVLGILAVGGAVLFGLPAVLNLFLNGFSFGMAVTSILANAGPLATAAILLPHGVLELPAMWLAAAAGCRVPYELVRYLREEKEYVLDRAEAVEIGYLVAVSVVLIVVAAWVEVQISPAVARLVA